MGPTPTELESFNELIQFDHIYFKPQPAGKKDAKSMVVQVKSDSQAENSPVKNVRVIITSDPSKTSGGETDRINTIKDVLQISEDVLTKKSQKSDVLKTQENYTSLMDDVKIELPSDEDHSALLDLNFDLLEDLESILQADSEGLACPDNVGLHSQMEELLDSSPAEKPLSSSRGQKRKAASLEVEAIMDHLTKDMRSPLNSDSDYMSDVATSPYSSQGVGSPLQDNLGIGSPLQDTVLSTGDPDSPLADTIWEESFTELFPDLL